METFEGIFTCKIKSYICFKLQKTFAKIINIHSTIKKDLISIVNNFPFSENLSCFFFRHVRTCKVKIKIIYMLSEIGVSVSWFILAAEGWMFLDIFKALEIQLLSVKMQHYTQWINTPWTGSWYLTNLFSCGLKTL